MNLCIFSLMMLADASNASNEPNHCPRCVTAEVNLGRLESLSFGRDFDQSLEHVQLPESLLSLCFGQSFNQTLESVCLGILGKTQCSVVLLNEITEARLLRVHQA